MRPYLRSASLKNVSGGGFEPFLEDALVPRGIEAPMVVDDEAPKRVLA